MGIHFHNVSFSYDKKASLKTLNNIVLDIENQGEFLMIMGHTGSGKSTLVQHMNALILPDEGKLVVFGQHIYPKNKEKLKTIRKKVGLVFQFPEYQLFQDTVIKDIMFGPLNFGMNTNDAKEAAINACKQVGITEELMERSPFSLSGGQMRRVAIAGILASNPDILILDEPTVGLDPKGKQDLLDLLEEIRTKYHKTIIVISHDMNVVAKHATRVIVMDEGKLVYDGLKRPLFSDLKRIYSYNLDLPECSKLALYLKEKGLLAFNDLPLDLNELKRAIMKDGQNL